METEPHIVFHGLDSSPAMSDLIRRKVAKLQTFHERITSCRVIVEERKSKGHKGHLYSVSVEMELPGGTVIVNHKPGDTNAHEDLKVAIRDSFDAARRRLEDHARKIGGIHVKSHPERQHGQVVRLFPDEGYGFIKTAAGTELYFQRDSVVRDDWAKLDIWSEVEFSPMDGEKGPFAVNVSVRD